MNMLRFCFAVLVYAALMVGGIAVCVRAAGTVWALPVFVVLFAAGYLCDAFFQGSRMVRDLSPVERGRARRDGRRAA